MTCPDCRMQPVVDVLEDHDFLWDDGITQIEFTAVVPMVTCTVCGFRWTDYRAEIIKDGVVKNFFEGAYAGTLPKVS